MPVSYSDEKAPFTTMMRGRPRNDVARVVGWAQLGHRRHRVIDERQLRATLGHRGEEVLAASSLDHRVSRSAEQTRDGSTPSGIDAADHDNRHSPPPIIATTRYQCPFCGSKEDE
jgi:hypothetical protein